MRIKVKDFWQTIVMGEAAEIITEPEGEEATSAALPHKPKYQIHASDTNDGEPHEA